MKKAFIIELVSLLFAILFLYTGIMKLREYDVFRSVIETTPILRPIAVPLAWGLPIAELILCLLLLIPATRIKALYGSFVLMILFTGYITALLLFSPHLPCSCGGVLESMTWTQHLIFNIVFILLAGYALLLHKQLNKNTVAL
ncbi:MauE/DoxX family redox-associated membrane protein [Chitinophaga sp. Cy-1792]|uniref:MauE/DoxX family redox-associated membrane protein n=1 Tax=Chitinophaga sp. Cy-1792 TaxID=2608339 RepID=UPI0014233F0F|nr:MauE/DoxX family redox-associated membrane protein [Chitinophaga sp. Cy-1792]NIG56465.1 DoxX family membrane protein [Chitinophaga sp. Cy-1792]